MRSTQLISALVAVGTGFVSAESCKDVKITTIGQPVSCVTIEGDLTVDSKLSGTIDLETVEHIKGDLIINKARMLTGFTSSSLKQIDGKFELVNLDLFSNLQLENLQSVSEIFFQGLSQLETMTFGTKGVSKATNITITDTHLSSLEGVNIATVGTFEVSNNLQLQNLQSGLVNVTDTLSFNANNPSMTINMTKLESAGVLDFRGVAGFDAPLLQSVGRLSFNNNTMKTFNGDNITAIADSLTFNMNDGLTNFSFASLTKIAGDVTIQNNDKLKDLTGFPKLESVFGGMIIGGVFERVNMPKLNHVTGTIKASTTTSSEKFCDFFDGLKSDGKIDAGETCTFKNKNALSNGDGGQQSDGSGGDSDSGSNSDSDGDGAAGIVSVNLGVLSLAAIVALAQLF